MKTSTFAAATRRRFSSLALSSAKMLFFALVAGSSAYAANDNLRDALVLDPGGRVSFIDITGFTTEIGENSGGNNFRTAWFVWTAPATPPLKVRFSTYGSNYNTVESLYKRDPNKTELLVTSLISVSPGTDGLVINDDDPNLTGGTTGYMEWTPVAGATYYISVGRNNNTNSGNLEATFAFVTDSANVNLIPNDNIASALQFVTTTPSTGQVPRGELVAGTTIGATIEPNESNIVGPPAPTAIAGGTVWYRYTTGTNPEVFTVAVTDIASDTVGETILQAFTSSQPPATTTIGTLTFINGAQNTTGSVVGTPRLVINGAANTDYYFRVSSTDGDGTNFNIRLDFNPVAPTNDNLAGAILLGPTLPIIRVQDPLEDNYSATDEAFPTTNPPGFTNHVTADVWYKWQAPASGFVRLRSIAPTATATTGNFQPDGSTFNFASQVFFDTTSPTDATLDTASAQRIAGFNNGNSAPTANPSLTFYAQKDVVYFIEIGSNDTVLNRGFFAFVLEDARVTDIARTGVSYGSEGVLKTIMAPVVNKVGDVAFQATLELGGPVTAAKDTALYLYNGASTRASVVEGQQEFGTALDIDGDGIKDDKVLFGTFSNLFLADRVPSNNVDPDLGFNATLTGKSDDEPLSALNNKGFYHDDPTNAGVRELRINDYMNDSYTWQDGAAFLASFNTPVRETVDNTALFTGKMAGIPAVRDTGLFASSRRVVVQEEDPAPNTAEDPVTEDGAEFGDQTGTPTVNSSNNMAFRAVLRGTGVTSTNDAAIYSVADYTAAPTALNYRLRLRKGSAVPGPDNTDLADGATIFSLGEPRVNGKGKIAVSAAFKPGSGTPAASAANDTVILSDLVSTDYSFAIVAREGDLAPTRDANGVIIHTAKFISFTSPVLITNNAVVFTGKVAGAGITAANNTGIWLWDGATVYLIAQTGTSAQGILPGNQTAQAPKYKTLGAPLANLAGRVAFTASIAGSGVTASNDTGLWTIEEDGVVPFLRLREGDIYNFDSTELPFRRSITSISVTTGSGGDDGFARGMDQDGFTAVTSGLNKGKTKYGQAVFKVAP